MKSKIAKFDILIMALVVVIDRLVKYLVDSNLNLGESRDIIGNFFSLTYVRNTGAAFSLFKDQAIDLLIFVPLCAVIFGIYFIVKFKYPHWSYAWAVWLVMAGAIGNLIDRFLYGYVIDMFDFHFWPVFNVADIAIVIGGLLLIWYILRYEWAYPLKSKKEHEDINGKL